MASLVKQKGNYYAQFYDAARQPKRKQVSLKTRKKRVARRAFARLEDQYALGEFDPWNPDDTRDDLKRLGTAVEAFIETRSHFSPHTVRKYWIVLGQLARHAGEEHPTAQLSTRHVQRFLDDGDRKPPTKKSYSNAIKAFCNWLIEQGVLEANPVDKLRLPRVPDKHPRFLTREDVDHLIETIRRHVRENPKVAPGTVTWIIPIIQTNVYLGLRRAEVTHLRWEHVDLERRQVAVVNTASFRTKNARDRTVPLCEAAHDVLTGLERRSRYVFPNHGGQRLHPDYLTRRFKRYARMADLPEDINFHSTRHTACSWLAMQGASVEAIRLFAGHSSVSVTEKYMHLSPDAYAHQISAAFAGISAG